MSPWPGFIIDGVSRPAYSPRVDSNPTHAVVTAQAISSMAADRPTSAEARRGAGFFLLVARPRPLRLEVRFAASLLPGACAVRLRPPWRRWPFHHKWGPEDIVLGPRASNRVGRLGLKRGLIAACWCGKGRRGEERQK